MLNDLRILNGNLELKFDPYTYLYTVVVEEDVSSLLFDYELKDEYNIIIRNNYLNNNENIVYLDFYNDKDIITYTFYVYKEKLESSNKIDSFMNSLDIATTKDVELYKIQFLCCGIFMSILIIFSLIFKRKRHR